MSKNTNPTEQSDRFKQIARDLGVELDEERLKEALRKMGKREEASSDDDK